MSFGGNGNEMTPAATKRAIRIEKKKKKMAAYLEISRLNEYDRIVKSTARNNNSNSGGGGVGAVVEIEPIPKRLKTNTGAEGNATEVVGYVVFCAVFLFDSFLSDLCK